jgi:hypothetical protein
MSKKRKSLPNSGFPEEVFVRWEEQGIDEPPIMIAERESQAHADITEQVIVGRYKLVDELTVNTRIETEPRDGGKS